MKVLFIPILLVFVMAFYYNSVAKQSNKKTLGYTVLGFFMPVFPFILFSLFIIIAHLILGHDPKFKIPKPVFIGFVFMYGSFVLMLPQYLKRRWADQKSN